MRRLVERARGTVDLKQFARFFVGGVMGAAANMLTFYLVRQHSYYGALVAGPIAGFVVSFFMSKLFAFQSRSLSRTHGELVRFVLVYCFGIGCFWAIAFVLGRIVFPHLMTKAWAENLGAFLGMGFMTVTSYFGHRYFTYRHVLAK